jgi:copper chaperone CopZ
VTEGEAIRFPVAGMTCGSCVNRITGAVRRLDGVTKVSVDLRNETATVRREPALVSNADLAAAVVVPHDEPHGLLDRLLHRRTTRRPLT